MPPRPLAASRLLPSAFYLLPSTFCLLLLASCAGPDRYTYEYIPGRTATANPDGTATIPPRAPEPVVAAIEAGNRIAGSPYARGGGHGGTNEGGGDDTPGDSAFDCSGAASYVLRATGRLRGSMPSRAFRHYGERGEGRWVSVWARRGHVFLVVAGLRFDTAWNGGGSGTGPRWTERSRPAGGYVIRHPAGL